MPSNWNKIKNSILYFKEISILSSANILTNVIGGLFWLYMASLIGPDGYGQISYFIGIAMIVASISLFGAGNSLIVFVAKGEKIQSVFFVITIITSVVGSIILFFMFENFGMSLYAVGFVIFTLVLSDLLGRKLYQSYAKYLIIQRISMVCVTIPFYFIFQTNGVLIGIAVSFLPFIFIIFKDFRQPINFTFMKSKIKVLFNMYLIDVATLTRGSLDKIIIVPFLGFSSLGNYQLGLQFIVILNIIPMAIYQYVLPHESSGLPTKKLKILAIGISGLLATIGAIMAPFVVPMLFPAFNESIQIIQILSFSIIPGTITMMYTSKFLGAEKPMFVVIGSLIFVAVQMIGIFGLKDIYGIYGVAFAMILGYLFEIAFFGYINKFVFKK
jgi:O-antigen/teichoic acid export membrane protein